MEDGLLDSLSSLNLLSLLIPWPENVSKIASYVFVASQVDQDWCYTAGNSEPKTNGDGRQVRWVAIGSNLNPSAEGSVCALTVSQVLIHSNVKLAHLTHETWVKHNHRDLNNEIQECKDV